MTVVWQHVSVTGPANGVLIQGSGNGPGTHATAVGGYIGGGSGDSSIDGSTAVPWFPLVGTLLSHDPGTDSTYGVCLFAVPPGVTVRAHIWCVTSE